MTALVFAYVLYTRSMRGARILAVERVLLSALATMHSSTIVKVCFPDSVTQPGNAQAATAGNSEKDSVTTATWPLEQCFSEVSWRKQQCIPFADWQRHAAFAPSAPGLVLNPANVSIVSV